MLVLSGRRSNSLVRDLTDVFLELIKKPQRHGHYLYMARLMFPARSPELEAVGAVLVWAVDKPGQSQVPSGQGGAPAGPSTWVVTKPA